MTSGDDEDDDEDAKLRLTDAELMKESVLEALKVYLLLNT